MPAVTELDSVILARSHAVRRRRSARGEVVRSSPNLRLNSYPGGARENGRCENAL